jgi:hypothetical protein
MPQIKVFNDNNRNYSVTSNGNVLGVLQYRYWYSSKAYITIGKEDEYTVERKGFWGNLHEVKHGGVVQLQLKTQWDGGIAIIKPKEKEHFYEFKRKGFFANGYVLTNYKGEELLLLKADFSWKKFTTGYTIDCNEDFCNNPFQHLLILLCVYHYKAAQAMEVAAVAN